MVMRSGEGNNAKANALESIMLVGAKRILGCSVLSGHGLRNAEESQG